MIEVDTPDGGVAEFPDGTPPDVIKNALRKKFPPQKAVKPEPKKPQLSWGETALDAAKSFGTGVEQGAIGLLGMPADIGNFLGKAVGRGIDWAVGATPEETAQREAKIKAYQDSALFQPPTSESLTKMVESVQGPLYKPQTTLGEYANTTGQFAAGAVAGPASVAKQVVKTGAKTFLPAVVREAIPVVTQKAKNAIIPGVVSEAAGQATEGTALEPYARFGGALAGGLAASTRGNVGTKQMLKEAPTREAVAADTKAAYDAIDKAGIVFDPNSYKSAAMKIKSDLAKKGWDKLQGGQVAPLLNRVDGMLKPRAVSDWTKVDGILKDAKSILRSPMADETTKMHVGIIVTRLEDLVENGKLAAKKGNMTRPQINETIKNARELARRNIMARDIEKMKNKSEWYLSGPESGLRNQFKSYGSKATGLTDAEDAAFKSVVRREGSMNVAHQLGSRIVQPILAAAGFSFGGPWGAAAAVLGSQGFRKFMEVYTTKGVDAALKTVLAGKNAQQRAAVLDAVALGERRAQALIAAESGRQSAQIPFLTDANGREYPYPAKVVPGQ